MKNRNEIMLMQIIEMLLGVTITSIGLSLMMKSGLGQTAVASFTQNLSTILDMKGGTVLMWFNMLCVLMQYLVQKKEFKAIQLLQFAAAYLQGVIINLICYDIPVLSQLSPGHYITQWVWMIFGILLASYGVAVMMTADLIKHPFEALCMILTEKWKIAHFSILRSRADMLFLFLSIVLIIVFRLDWITVREGTWVCMLLLGRSMAYTFPLAQNLSKYHQHMLVLEKLATTSQK